MRGTVHQIRRLLTATIVVLAVPVTITAQQSVLSATRLDTLHFAPMLGVDLSRATVTASGAYVRELAAGSGARAIRGNTVSVRWRAWLPDGSAIGGDSAQLFTFRVGAGVAMPGLDEGVRGMLVGGRRQIIVPANAQGPSGMPGVPRGAPVVFAVELVAAR